jgi:Tfp pilus assembly protein PilZ
VHLLALDHDLDEPRLAELTARLRVIGPLLKVVLLSREPSVENARAALRHGVAGYLPWPTTPPGALVARVREILKRARRERLLDNLLIELHRETARALGCEDLDAALATFRELVGLERLPRTPETAPDAAEAVEYLDEVLDSLLAPDEEVVIIDELTEGPELAAATASERRVHTRVPESQFVRFRARASHAATLALLGDISEGGIFIRCSELLGPGTIVDVDFNVLDEQQAYLIRCRGQVAWVARDDRQSPLGPGFGVKFLEPPEEVVELLKRIVAIRTATAPSAPDAGG